MTLDHIQNFETFKQGLDPIDTNDILESGALDMFEEANLPHKKRYTSSKF